MLYNLLISGGSDTWEGNSTIFDRSRCIKENEYMSKELAEKYAKLGSEEINELKTFPCIFAYENYVERDPYFGFIIDVMVRREGIKITFEKVNLEKFLSYKDLDDLKFELDISEWELNRTHWAVKDVELDKVLSDKGVDLKKYILFCQIPVNITTHYFDVSFTFAGETRSYVEKTVNELQSLITMDRIFYDNFYKAQLARPNIDVLLQNIYRNQSKLVVVFLCEKYQEKEWCGIEFRAIKEMIKEKESDRIMFVRLDDGHVEGVFSTDGYIDGRIHTPREIAGFILQRINLLHIK